MQNDKSNDLDKTVEQFIGDVTTWKKTMDEEMKSVRLDLKKSLEMQKNIIKSFHSMKKKKIAIERKFDMVQAS